VFKLIQNILLDSFWEGQDIIYDFRAQLYGTGSIDLRYVLSNVIE